MEGNPSDDKRMFLFLHLKGQSVLGGHPEYEERKTIYLHYRFPINL